LTSTTRWSSWCDDGCTVVRCRPRENRFEADEFAAELARHGLHNTGRTEPHFGGALFVGAARKI
jgi:hypothetical protein